MTEQRKQRCPLCGLKIRGKNHDEGLHHKGRIDSIGKAKLDFTGVFKRKGKR